MSNINQLAVSNFIQYQDNLYQIVEISHNKTARRGAIIKLKVRNCKNGNISVINAADSDNIKLISVQKIVLDYLYAHNDELVFWNNESFEEVSVDKHFLSDDEQSVLIENLPVNGMLWNDEIIAINIPDQITVKIKSTTDDAIKGNTVSSAQKQAILENDVVCSVPLFIRTNDIIVYNIKTKKYVKRVKN